MPTTENTAQNKKERKQKNIKLNKYILFQFDNVQCAYVGWWYSGWISPSRSDSNCWLLMVLLHCTVLVMFSMPNEVYSLSAFTYTHAFHELNKSIMQLSIICCYSILCCREWCYTFLCLLIHIHICRI